MAVDDALELMTTGEHVGAEAALKWGVVDKVVPGDACPIEAAAEFCRSKMGVDLNPRRLSLVPPPPTSKKGFDVWRKEMNQKRAGETAAQLIVDCVEAASKGPTFKDGVKFEAMKFSGPGGVLDPKTSQFQELQYMFSAERDGGKLPAIKTKPQKIRSVGIVGGGLMGGGIGMSCAEAGMSVTISEVDETALNRGIGLIKSNYERSVSRGSRTKESAAEAFGRIKGSVGYADLGQCDLIVEAVFEDMSVKKEIFKKLDQIAKPGAFICSNTSALDIDEIASVTSRPEFVMGTHFFSPANVMKMLENVRGKKTSDLTIATCMAWGKEIGKWPILVGNCPGFVGNRLIFKYNEQSARILAAGALPNAVDSAIEGFGNKMGPFRMADMVGLDLGIQAAKKSGRFLPDKVFSHALVDAGRLGQKSKKGFYDYSDGRSAKPSEEANAIIGKVQKNLGATKANFTPEQLVGRMFFPLVNEGFKVLEEGFVQRPSDIDVCYVHGYGFPRYRGGPMYHADKVGLKTVRDTLVEMDVKPAALLEECVAAGKPLAKYWSEYSKKKAAASKL
jgi:3-hydroxyacyl-CoA dehydrogenase